MDNRVIDIRSEGRRALDLAFELMWDNAPGGKATHYFDHPLMGLIFLWNEDSFVVEGNPYKVTANKLPYAMDWKAAADLAWGWLGEQPNEKYGDFLDHDGSNGRGFRVYNESWTHVAGSHYGILAVLPMWAWYGK